MDKDNPIVRLCAAGMEAEGKGDSAEAVQLFGKAWEEHHGPWEGCVAAHYVARHQETAEATLSWNLRALGLARDVVDGSAADFLPSLLLNVAHSYEVLGNLVEAKREYELAEAEVARLPEDGYGRYVSMGIAAGLQRIRSAVESAISP
jgi:hypothetical protein